MRPVLLYRTGRAPEPIAARFGDFSDWFGRLFDSHAVTVTEYNGVEPSAPPDPRHFAGIVITGSPASLTEPEHWMEGAVETIRECHRFGTPLLGVCFGHQLIGAAYGAAVLANPRGWEVGSHEIIASDAAAADPLFSDVFDRDRDHDRDHDRARSLAANFSHRDAVAGETVSPLNGLRVLAASSHCDTQVIAAGDHIRGIQFHPEFTGAITAAYVRHHYDELAAESERNGSPDRHPERLLEGARDCPAAERVFHNFLRHFVGKS